MRAAIAFCLGFGAVFTLLGVTVYVGGSLASSLVAAHRGLVLIVLGLNMMGVIRIDALWRSWRPLERTAMPTGSSRRLGAGTGRRLRPGRDLRRRLDARASGRPGRHPWPGGPGTEHQAVGLFIAYAIGLAVPFLLLALTLDRAPALIRPLIRHGRAVELIGGGLVVVIGLALIFDWLGAFARAFSFLWPQVYGGDRADRPAADASRSHRAVHRATAPHLPGPRPGLGRAAGIHHLAHLPARCPAAIAGRDVLCHRGTDRGAQAR